MPEGERKADLALFARNVELCDVTEALVFTGPCFDAGFALTREIAARKAPGEPERVLTHCSVAWPATVDWGTASPPIYHAQGAAIPVHVFMDDTRPTNRGAQLTPGERSASRTP